jgi:hypothetical protein
MVQSNQPSLAAKDKNLKVYYYHAYYHDPVEYLLPQAFVPIPRCTIIMLFIHDPVEYLLP